MSTFFGQHPENLYSICLTEIGERFSFYMARNILVLYMIKVFLFSNAQAYTTFATFTAFLYFTPLIGGYLADRWLGIKSSIFFGGLLLSLGYFLLAYSNQSFFYFSLALIIIGDGFFMPNIANAIGQLYQQNDSRRESGFTIFYIAIQIGALLPALFAGWIISQFGWHNAFLSAAIVILLVTIRFYFNSYSTLKYRLPYFLLASIIISLFSLALLIKNAYIANMVIFLFSGIFIFYALKKSFSHPPLQRNRLLIGFILTAFSILFWALFEQAGMSLTIFTEYNVQRSLGAWTIPTTVFFIFNPFFVITCGPLIAKMWLWLDSYHLNPSTPAKFAYGTLLMGLGFAILPLAIKTQAIDGYIQWYWIAISYFLQSLGELFISPVGLSMIVELSPKEMNGLMMGVWYFATAIANVLAGFIAKWTTIPSGSNLPLITSAHYAQVFSWLAVFSIVAGFIMLIFIPLFKKMITASVSCITPPAKHPLEVGSLH
ncbi:MAG: MFS transporter [Gammaproteobacteria bacterium]|nr:MAG: MFS transporter [Gammaproteobacteria bacterium]